MRESEILFEGPCAYAVQTPGGYEVRVFSTNATTHMVAGKVADAARAEFICAGLNAYPAKARGWAGLL